MKKLLTLVAAAMIAFPALVNAQQSLYFGGVVPTDWNPIQMTTAEGTELPYIATGQYAAWVLVTDDKQISTSDYKGVKLEYVSHVANENDKKMLVNVIPEGTEWKDQQHTEVPVGDHEGNQAVTVDFEDVVKDKTIKELRLWAPEKGIQILLKKVWLIKNDDKNTLEEQNFSLAYGGWNWSKTAQAAPQLTFPVQYCGQTVCDSEICNLVT